MNSNKLARERRGNLLVNVLQAICILTFVTCIAIDPQLHGLDNGATPVKTSDAR